MILTEYCCRLVLGDDWEEVCRELDSVIRSGKYQDGVAYIRGLDVTLDKKERLERCLLSYEGGC